MSLSLKVINISKSYNGKSVLEDCSVSFDRGGIHILMGPNGSGKSTFLRICALLERPDKGKINYYSGDKVESNDISLKRRITLLLPRVGVFNTSVFKNVIYGLKIRGVSNKEIQERANRALQFVGLIYKKNNNALTLSSGETQRLGIARAMIIEPEILFLDEPTASVDEENTEIIEDIILNMSDRLDSEEKLGRSTVIIATHDITQAERLSGRMLIMQNGKIL